jgi:hypothetical protein
VFPLRDNIPSRTFPIVTLMIIVANVLAFFWEISLGPRLEGALWRWAIIPARFTDREVGIWAHPIQQLVPFFSSMFLHGGWLHLIGNMWTFWIFGDNVEDRLGHDRFALLYLASGLAAGAVHIFTNAGSAVPTIGASGAVAGVMGAYFRFYPRARVATVIPPFIFGPVFVLPAVVFLGFWFLLQFFNGVMSLGEGRSGFAGIAWWAHVGGFGFGALVCLFAARRHPRDRAVLTEYD